IPEIRLFRPVAKVLVMVPPPAREIESETAVRLEREPERPDGNSAIRQMLRARVLRDQRRRRDDVVIQKEAVRSGRCSDPAVQRSRLATVFLPFDAQRERRL